MRDSNIIPIDAQVHFWVVVEQCIREFHANQLVIAIENMRRLQASLEDSPIEEFEIFFHAEPFHVACALSRQHISLKHNLDRYLKIRDEEGVRDV